MTATEVCVDINRLVGNKELETSQLRDALRAVVDHATMFLDLFKDVTPENAA